VRAQLVPLNVKRILLAFDARDFGASSWAACASASAARSRSGGGQLQNGAPPCARVSASNNA